MDFGTTFLSVGDAAFKLLVIGLAGYLFTKLKALSAEGVRALSRVVVGFTLPCLIFSNIVTGFRPGAIPYWWLFPLGGILWSLGVLAFGLGISTLLGLRSTVKDQFSTLLSFQNAGYIPLPLAAALLPPGERETVFMYIFLWTMGSSPLLWSMGTALVSGRLRDKSLRLRALLTPPFVATSFTVTLSLCGFARYVPQIVVETASLAGEMTVPLIMFALGGLLGTLSLYGRANVRELGLLVGLKLLFLPLVALAAIRLLQPDRLVAFLILLQAASPPATGLAVMASHYTTSPEFINKAILYTYLCSIVTIPLFVSALDLVL